MYPYYDLTTLLLYIILGCIFALCVHYRNKYHKSIFLFLSSAIFVVFAISRTVGYHLGGEDSYNYEQIFLYGIQGMYGMQDVEPLFAYFTKCIRQFTDNPVVYRFFCYSIIALGSFKFIDAYCPYKSSSIPFIALILPFILSFNTMRSSIAAAMVLLAMVILKRGHWMMAITILLSSVFVHRMSAIFIPFLPFYYFLIKRPILGNKFKYLIFVCVCVVGSVSIAKILQSYIFALGVLDGADSFYLMRNAGQSFLSATTYVLPLILILIFMMFSSFKKIYEEHPILLLIVTYDIIIFPAAFMLGMWRVNEFFYVARLILWSIMISQLSSRFKSDQRILVKAVFFLGFLFWITNRINSIWEDAALMPYIINWF